MYNYLCFVLGMFFTVLFDADNITYRASRARIRASTDDVAKGQVVEARYSDGVFYKATVIAMEGIFLQI